MALRWLNIQALANQYPNRADFVAKLLKAILDSHGETPGKLDKMISTSDFDQLAFLSHSVKGVCSSVLALTLSQIASDAEQAARVRRADAVDLAKKLNLGLQEFLAEIRAHLTPEK